MDDELERTLFQAKCVEHAVWTSDSKAWHCEGLDDWDAGPSPSLSCYRVGHEPDDTGVIIDVVFADDGRISTYVVMASLHIDDPILCATRDEAIAKYDALVGTGDGWTSSISSQAQADQASEP